MGGVSVERPVDEAARAGDRREARGLARWILAIAVVATVVSIGLPLIGVRVFLATDSLEQYAPWRDAKPRLVHSTNTILGDTYDTGMPVHIEFRRRLFSGNFALWTPYPSGGTPLAAIPDGGPLSPLSLPYLVFPIWYAPAAAKLLEMAVALAFCFLFLRRVGLSRAAGLLGGLVYMNSGFQAVWTNWPQSHVGALIPALFWGVERAFALRRPRDAVPVAAVVASMFLEGFPAVTFYSLIAAAVYLLVRIASERPLRVRARATGTLWTGFGVAIGGGLAAFQLLPFVFHLRQLNLAYRVFQQHLPWYALQTLVVPNVLGSPAARTWFAPTSNYVELQSFIGATAFVLVLAGLIRRRSRNGIAPGFTGFVYGGIAVTAVLIYAGGPLLHVVQSLPLLGMNWIGRLRAVFLFLLSMAAAVGFAAVTTRSDARRRRGESLMWAAVAVAGAVFVAHLWSVTNVPSLRSYVLRNSIIPVLCGLAAFALVVRSVSSQQVRRWAAVTLPVLVAVESLAFVLPFWPRVPRSEFYPVTSAHRFLRDHLGDSRLAASQITMYAGTTTVYGIRSVTSHTFQTPEWNEMMTAVDPSAFAQLGPTHALLAPTEAVATSRVLDRLGAKYFAADPTAALLGGHAALESPVGSVRLRAGAPVEVPVPPVVVRGVTLDMARPASLAVRPLLVADALDGAGRVLGSGTRRVPAEFAGGEISIPIAGEPKTARLRIAVRDVAAVTVRADGAGHPVAAPITSKADGLRLVFAGPAVIYQRMNVLPRVRWASRARVVASPAEQLRLLRAGVPADTVLLAAPGPAASGHAGRVRVAEDDGDAMRLEVDAGGAGYVVVADALQDGWIASIDGNAAALVPADRALVAVPVPAGRHVVELAYRPKGFRRGVALSLASLVLAIGVLSVDRLRSGRRNAVETPPPDAPATRV